MDSREWMAVFEDTSSTMQSTQLEVMQFHSSKGGVRIKRSLTKKIGQAKDNVLKLQKSLTKFESNPSENGIGRGEITRRKQLLQGLNTLVHNVDDELNTTRGQVPDYSMGNYRGEESDETKNVDNTGLHSQQTEKMRDQDQKLDEIYLGVKNLKTMSSEINQELGLHERLLDDLDTAVDKTDKHMVLNTKGVDHIQKKSKNCCTYIIIFLLMVLIVVFAVSDLCPILQTKKCRGVYPTSAPTSRPPTSRPPTPKP